MSPNPLRSSRDLVVLNMFNRIDVHLRWTAGVDLLRGGASVSVDGAFRDVDLSYQVSVALAM